MKSLKNLGDWQVSEVEVVYKTKVDRKLLPKISGSADSYGIFMKYWNPGKLEYQEQSKALLLNNQLRVLAIVELATGGIDHVNMDTRIIFSTALVMGANRIVLAHNHPTGNITPSEADRRYTKNVAEAGKLMQIEILDHLIIAADGYYSFADEGLLL
ncbi:JAB domain-containing protein [Pedobacter sp.]